MSYFHVVSRTTPTRVWVNNPTPADARRAISDGAIACTTNPTYAAREIQSEPEVALAVVDDAVRRYGEDRHAAEHVQRELCRRILEVFLPLHRADATRGFVSIQGDPTAEDDAESIIEGAMACRSLGANYIAKVPVTAAGLRAIEVLAAEGVAVIATEIMAVSQALAACAAYERAIARSSFRPVLYITHITGILEQYLAETTERSGLTIPREDLSRAAVAAAHRQERLLRARGVPHRMLGGGARGIHHFTEMVGLDMDVTINWTGTADELLSANPPVVSRREMPEPRDVVERMRGCLPDFRRAWDEDGLRVEEFRDYGPVALFRGMFEQGWARLLDTVAERRSRRRD